MQQQLLKDLSYLAVAAVFGNVGRCFAFTEKLYEGIGGEAMAIEAHTKI